MKSAFLFTAPVVFAYAMLLTFMLTGCFTPPLASPKQAAVTVLPVQKADTGFYLDDANKAYLVSNGVPTEFFVSTSRGWFISKLQEEQAADILLKDRNP